MYFWSGLENQRTATYSDNAVKCRCLLFCETSSFGKCPVLSYVEFPDMWFVFWTIVVLWELNRLFKIQESTYGLEHNRILDEGILSPPAARGELSGLKRVRISYEEHVLFASGVNRKSDQMTVIVLQNIKESSPPGGEAWLTPVRRSSQKVWGLHAACIKQIGFITPSATLKLQQGVLTLWATVCFPGHTFFIQ